MWTSARLSPGCVKEEIALTLLDLLSANALLDTNFMKCHKNVKVISLVLCRYREWGRANKMASAASLFTDYTQDLSVFPMRV